MEVAPPCLFDEHVDGEQRVDFDAKELAVVAHRVPLFHEGVLVGGGHRLGIESCLEDVGVGECHAAVVDGLENH